MNLGRIARTLLIISALVANVGCDQVSKHIVRHNIDFNEHIRLLNNHVTLMKVENTGAFLTAGQYLPETLRFILLTVMPSLVLAFAIFYLIKKTAMSRTTLLGVCFVVGGGIGNVFDRMWYGSVTDFMHIDFGFFQTGVFNMADVSIMTGVALMIIDLAVTRRREKIPKTLADE